MTNSGATLNGTLTALKGYSDNICGVVFRYGQCEDMLNLYSGGSTMDGTGDFNNDISGLLPNTTYYFQALAIHGTDTAWAADTLTFTTLTVPCPGAVRTNEHATELGSIDSVRDVEGNSYATVQIGSQCWMAQNLRTTQYADGTTPVSLGFDTSTSTAYRYFPDGDTNNVATYGHLYNWKAVMGSSTSSNNIPSGVQGICPDGWHVPSDAEWTQLTDYVNSQSGYKCGGTDKNIAKALASATGWKSSSYNCSVGNNLSPNNAAGFSAVPAGFYSGSYSDFGSYATFWSATQIDTIARSRFLGYGGASVIKYNKSKNFGFSVRCLRDPLTVTTDSANTVTKNGATLYGNVKSLGKYTTAQAGFRYGTSASTMTNIVSDEVAMMAAGQFSYGITGLTANTKYYYKAFSANGTDTVYGEVKNFKTLSINPCPNAATVTDVDNNVYNTVQIGNQCWMAENLRTTKYANGTAIANGGTTPSITTAYRYFPGGDTNNVATYGHLYNWKAVMGTSTSSKANPSGVQGICPDGWHVPSDAEWTQLTAYVKSRGYKCNVSPDNIAKALASTTGWMSSPDYCDVGNDPSANNATGFSAVPAGSYNGSRSGFDGVGGNAYFWSATSIRIYAYYRSINYSDEYVTCDDHFRDNGYSVRCLRDPLTVVTTAVSSITANSAICGGNVLADGGSAVTARGVCWSTSQNPTTADGHTTDGSGTGSFNSSITGLSGSTTYYVRAYAANGTDTVYGEVKNFTTAADIVTDTIVFFANGGIGTMDTMFVTRGDTVLNANTYTHGGNWQFTGWNTAADGSGTQYADHASITTSGNLTLYAQWHTWCTGIPKTSVNEFGTSRIDSVKDIDNNKYNVVQIGDQCWMAQNLRTTKYADGTSISLGSTTSTETAYHYYPTGSSSNVSKYGYLYNWKAVMGNSTSSETNPSGVQGICPKGWHVPSDTEWTQLTNYVSSQSEYVCESINTYNAKALASTTGWNSSSNTCVPGNNPSDNNATGFSAVPAGYYSGGYGSFGDDAHFWSATQYYNSYAYSRYVDYNYADVHKYNYEEYYGFSVRCLRDPLTVTTDSANTITKNSAKLYGNVTNMGGFAEVNAGFRYGQHPDYMTFRTERTVSSTGSFNAELTNISPNTTYYFQSYAATATDTAWASDTLTFTTLTNPCSVASIRGNERGTGKQIDSVKDHEDNWYKVVQIGNQCWLAENMRATTEPGSSTHIALNTDASLTEPRIYSTDSGYVARYGYLYNFPAAMNTSSDDNHFTYPHRGICPEGWHVPTKDDWDLLAATAGVPDHLYVPGTTEFTDGLGKLTGGTDWITSTWRTSPGCYNYIYRDSTGFSARPASCYYDGKIENVGESAYFWTSSEDDYYLHIYYSYGAILYGSGEAHSSGFSIRCLRDAEVPAAMSVTTDSANTITKNSATLYGNVTDMGGKSEVNAGFKYGTSESALTSIVSDGVSTTAPGMFSFGITGLTANTQYYYKAFAANGTDTVYGEVMNFKTLSINPCPNMPTVTDVDNNVYNTVQIGDQCWMKENLRTTKYADGTPISLGNSKSTSTAYRYYPNNDSNTVSTYGYLYNWRAAMRYSSSSENNPSGVQGICPTGWHLPSDAEWTQLTDYVSSQSQYRCNGNASFISKSLAATSGWRRDDFACAIGNYQFLNNATDFSGVPSGDYSGDYALFANSAYFWSTTLNFNDSNSAYIRLLYYNSESVIRNYNPIDFGFGVRCLRN
ncbi:MAG: hypothetical protein MJZ72_00640 [Bacteroidales bacterium]|nr:hypothetical protein [Bacteroidales bacterium]